MPNQWIQFEGKLKYGKGNRVVADVSPELTRLYRSFIPKHIKINIPRYYPHITVVRGKHETPANLKAWGKHDWKKIKFEYSPDIQFGRTYIWLKVRSKEIEEIRNELGLSGCFDRFKGYHITIANMKKLNQ
jgi:2'-5' RNA ligase